MVRGVVFSLCSLQEITAIAKISTLITHTN